MHSLRIFRSISLVFVVLVLSVTGFAQVPASLNNSDIEKMVKAHVPESIIVRTIQVSQPNFVVTPDALVSLKHHHVPDGVLGAMVDSQGGYQPRAMYPPVHGGQIHQLPNIDAAIRLDDKSIGKVQIRKNQIKVEKAGVPLLSVKWQVNGEK